MNQAVFDKCISEITNEKNLSSQRMIWAKSTKECAMDACLNACGRQPWLKKERKKRSGSFRLLPKVQVKASVVVASSMGDAHVVNGSNWGNSHGEDLYPLGLTAIQTPDTKVECVDTPNTRQTPIGAVAGTVWQEVLRC